MLKYFWELDTDAIRDSVVIIDIDGTVACSQQEEIHEGVDVAVRALREYNDVYFFSNSFKIGRNHHIAHALMIPLIQTIFRKPLPWGIRQISPESSRRPRIVIGDRILTDGLFAYAIGARFIKVARLTCTTDPLWANVAYWVDDVLARFINDTPRRT